jgi:hypothetical protein
MKWFHHLDFPSCETCAKLVGAGGFGREIFFGDMPVAVRQGRQRRDASAAGEKQLGRCAAGQRKHYRLYLSSGKLFSWRCTFSEFESLAVASWRRWRMFQELLR